MPYQNATESSQNRLGAVSPVEGQIFRDTTEETIQRIWTNVKTFYEGPCKGFGEIKFINRLQYIEDKAKVYSFEMGVRIEQEDISHLVKSCPTIADIDLYFRMLYDRTYFPDRLE